MINYFFDSSALLKRYHSEQGSAWVLASTASTARNTIFIAQIAPVEVISGIERQRRDGRLVASTVSSVRSALDHDVQYEYNVVVLGNLVVRRAQDILGRYPLRAYDAVQLASALEANLRLVADGLARSSSSPPTRAC
jgi:predicted nucleic acid-binding protein